jgi:hypothetical protein
MSVNESAIVNEVIRALWDIPGVWIWRNNCGVAKPPGAKRAIRFGIPGQADISGMVMLDLGIGLPLGIRLEVECKVPGGRMSQEQKDFQARVESLGGCYLLVHSAEEAVRELQAWRADRTPGRR